MLARIRTLLMPGWRTVAVARRSTLFAGAIYPLHGVATREPTRVRYEVLLQETARGRRRWRIDCRHPQVSTSSLHADPIIGEVRAWKRGGMRPDRFVPHTGEE